MIACEFLASGRLVDTIGIEPTTPGLQGQVAPLEHGCPRVGGVLPMLARSSPR